MQVELTQEEATIVNMMTEGFTVRQIAAKLNTKPHIVGHRMYALRKRAGCKSSMQLIAKLFREEFLQ
jgi:DNA-binding NarL/FixJ family response regulator